MKKIIILLIYTFCSFSLFAEQKIDSLALQECKAIVDEINALPLYKLQYQYYYNKWDIILPDENNRYDDGYMIVYLDVKGRIRKYVYRTGTEDNHTSLLCYYDTSGRLRFLVGSNGESYTPLYEHGFQENGVIYSIGKKIVLQNMKHSSGNGDNYKIERNICSKCRFPSYLGTENIQHLISAISLSKHIGLNTKAMEWNNSMMVTFVPMGDSNIDWTWINQNDVKIMAQPKIGSNEMEVRDAGYSVNSYIGQTFKQINDGITWYKVSNYSGYSNPVYIDGKYLEPVEKIIE
jgi:hypothetical protein